MCTGSNHPGAGGDGNETPGCSSAIWRRNGSHSTSRGRGFGRRARFAYPSRKLLRCTARSSTVSNTRASFAAGSGPLAMSRAECTSELTGASELFTSWLITRITRLSTSTSRREISRVKCFTRSSVWSSQPTAKVRRET